MCLYNNIIMPTVFVPMSPVETPVVSRPPVRMSIRKACGPACSRRHPRGGSTALCRVLGAPRESAGRPMRVNTAECGRRRLNTCPLERGLGDKNAYFQVLGLWAWGAFALSADGKVGQDDRLIRSSGWRLKQKDFNSGRPGRPPCRPRSPARSSSCTPRPCRPRWTGRSSLCPRRIPPLSAQSGPTARRRASP